MTEKIINTRRGVYGIVNVTLPIHMKTLMLERAKKLGYKRAEFLRLALLTGFATLSETINVLTPVEDPEKVGANERTS